MSSTIIKKEGEKKNFVRKFLNLTNYNNISKYKLSILKVITCM